MLFKKGERIPFKYLNSLTSINSNTIVTKYSLPLGSFSHLRERHRLRLASLKDLTEQKIPDTRSLVWVPFNPFASRYQESMALS